MPTWDSSQYLQFIEERTQPAVDLAGRIKVDAPQRIIDLGCGPGNSTAVLARRWPSSQLTGLDSSAEMIATARRQTPDGNWQMADIAAWPFSTSERFDVVFSNAALQWVPDHARLLPQLFARVSAGGAFALQIPGNFDSPAHRLMRDLAASTKWIAHFNRPIREWAVHDLPFYYELLAPLSSRLDLWTTDYLHVMEGPASIVEWYKGTGLRPYLDLLPDSSNQKRFLEDYQAEITRAYPSCANGRVLFPFRRLFVIAYR